MKRGLHELHPAEGEPDLQNPMAFPESSSLDSTVSLEHSQGLDNRRGMSADVVNHARRGCRAGHVQEEQDP